MTEDQSKVPSPESTGGGGVSFEQHVGAYALSLLLARAIPPILTDCELTEVHFQTKHLEWKTDDILLRGMNGNGQIRQLAAQVKLGFTISSKDPECVKTIANLWSDFQNSTLFERGRDALAIVVRHGTNALLTHCNALLDCARASLDASDFERRLTPSNYTHSTTRNYCDAIRAIVNTAQGSPATDEDFLAFLRHVHVISLDLGSLSSCTLAQVKSLLMQTTIQADKPGGAQSTWDALVREVTENMRVAKSYTRDDLPAPLHRNHIVLGSNDHSALSNLRNHGRIVIDAIRDRIGDSVVLRRDDLMLLLRERLEESQVIVITGGAGSGKSGLARRLYKELGQDHFAFAFRAEEFAVAHIDLALRNAHVEQNAIGWREVLCGQERKLLVVESVERLLEASVRDGFSDLLQFVAKDPSWRLLLTCRDYSLETVRSSLLDPTGLSYSIVSAVPLTDGELQEVAEQIPELREALGNPSLRPLFRNPYILDRAALMKWLPDEILPQGERSFRRLFWRDIVRYDADERNGLPLRREKAFMEIAVRRARALQPFINCSDLDPEVVLLLRHQDVISFHPATKSLCAPSHDVLEDWAVIHWLEQQFHVTTGDPGRLALEIGGAPALRRGFRRWLGEMLEFDQSDADALVLAVIGDKSLPGQFRDDTIVSALLSTTASQFLSRHRAMLVSGNFEQLFRVVHLLRLACVTSPQWLPEAQQLMPGFVVPRGKIWENVINLVENELELLLPTHLPIILGLIEDWCRGVTWWTPEPEGINAVARIAFAILQHLKGHSRDDARQRVFAIIAMVPTGARDSFLKLVHIASNRDEGEYETRKFSDLLLTGMSGAFACRFFPDAIIGLARTSFLRYEIGSNWFEHSHSPIDLNPVFGLRRAGERNFFPASAWRGPFLQLLRWHPDKGIAFIVELLNHAAEWYGKRKWPGSRLEEAYESEIQIPGIGKRLQWANGRLWCLYRGTTVGPYVLQTALMALEQWLFEQSEQSEFDLEPRLLHLLDTSNNIAVTAVVASLCNAYPHRSGRAALALLSCRDLFGFDRERVIHESSVASLSFGMASLGIEAELYAGEREQAAAKPHRRNDLEVLSLNLQLGKYQADVEAKIDEHRKALPEERSQTEEDKLWRLALHRMDLRKYEAPEVQPKVMAEPVGSAAENRRLVYLKAKEPDRDIQAMLDKTNPTFVRSNALLALFNWAISAWRGEPSVGADSASWHEQLVAAQEIAQSELHELEVGRHGPGYVAAVCARDHWGGMDDGERAWCTNALIREVERHCDSDDDIVSCSRNSMDASRPAAYVLPQVLARLRSSNNHKRVLSAIAKSLTHTSTEVQYYAAEGMSTYLSGEHDDLLLGCAGALAMKAEMLNRLDSLEQGKSYDERTSPQSRIKAVIPQVRMAIESGSSDPRQLASKLDLGTWPTRAVIGLILVILRRRPTDLFAIEIHLRVARHLAAIWLSDNRRGSGRIDRDFDSEHEWLDRLARFALRTPATQAVVLCDPLLAAIGRHPREVSSFISDLIVAEDQADDGTAFWAIWDAAADYLEKAPWLEQLDDRYAPDDGLVHRMFLGIEWKKGVYHWRKLDGNAWRIDGLFMRLPPSMRVLESYCTFLHSIGRKSLPEAFNLIGKQLRAGSVSTMLGKSNTRFILEGLLGSFVYGKPKEAKSDPILRESILFILEQLVDSGSSHAFRMRDDFVTPIS